MQLHYNKEKLHAEGTGMSPGECTGRVEDKGISGKTRQRWKPEGRKAHQHLKTRESLGAADMVPAWETIKYIMTGPWVSHRTAQEGKLTACAGRHLEKKKIRIYWAWGYACTWSKLGIRKRGTHQLPSRKGRPLNRALGDEKEPLTWEKGGAFQEKGTEWTFMEEWLSDARRPSPWSKRLELATPRA